MQRNPNEPAVRADIERILHQDPTWSAYALADLQPAYAPHCQWYTDAVKTPMGVQAEGVLLIFTALTPPILLTVGDAAVVAALLTEVDQAAQLPQSVFISAREEHVPLIQEYYRFDLPEQGTSFNTMMRMAFRHPEALQDIAMARVTRLGPADAGQIAQLIAYGGPYAPDAFEAYQLDEGVFFGIHNEDGELLAVGGTHIVDWQGGIGAVGNMYTHPDYRGKGYARLILGAVVQTLQSGGVENIILNVNTQNQTARRIYRQYGFEEHCSFVEGIGLKRDA